ncbi:hypothetical protein BC936DRAFT_150088 [Jimgerdemannia flammicorona]|uniref:Proteasome assembly chaperone 2 n=1 Tax=Jimgerdemannia flammicorona TaxID=994334 RepID=A0A433CZI6_9FUNG|nr:hypothetical protein BC936DRAFT_150088 [Jimgerdemannia flammicorona]
MDTFVPIPSFNPAALAGSTLILPSVSIGNVPQLTTDLLVNTFGLNRVGFLHDETVIPIAGAREETQGAGVTVAIEVFQSADRKWTVVQQRAPLIKVRPNMSVQHDGLVDFFPLSLFSRFDSSIFFIHNRTSAVFLSPTSSPSSKLTTSRRSSCSQAPTPPEGLTSRSQGNAAPPFLRVLYLISIFELINPPPSPFTLPTPNSQPFRLLAHPPTHPLLARAHSLSLPLLEILPPTESDVFLRRLEEQEGKRHPRDEDDEAVPEIPGGGAVRALFVALKRTAVPVVAVLVFALEGGAVVGWKPPKSWEGLFGTPFQAELYQ